MASVWRNRSSEPVVDLLLWLWWSISIHHLCTWTHRCPTHVYSEFRKKCTNQLCICCYFIIVFCKNKLPVFTVMSLSLWILVSRLHQGWFIPPPLTFGLTSVKVVFVSQVLMALPAAWVQERVPRGGHRHAWLRGVGPAALHRELPLWLPGDGHQGHRGVLRSEPPHTNDILELLNCLTNVPLMFPPRI